MESYILNRIKMPQPVRIDLSDTYLENDRLSEELDEKINLIHRYKHSQFINRALEIMELKKTLKAFQTLTKTNKNCDKQQRPRTSSAFRPTRQASMAKIDVRLPAETRKKSVTDSDTDSDIISNYDDDEEDEDDDRCISALEKKSKVSKLERAMDVLGIRTLRKDWFTTVHDPGDVSVKRPMSSFPRTRPTPILPSSKITRAKSAPSAFKKSTPTAPTEITTVMSLYGETAKAKSKGMKFVCSDRRAASASMSRRQLKELNYQHLNPEACKHVDAIHVRLEKSKQYSEALQTRVKLFLKSIDNLSGTSKPIPYY